MKKPYLRSAIATVGLLAGTLIIDAQSGAGGAAAGAAAGGASAATGTAATPGTAGSAATETGTVAPGGQAVRGSSPASTGGRANPAGTVNTVGGASALEARPNNIGADGSGITAPAAPGTAQGAQRSTTSAQTTTLPTGVQNTLGGFAANGQLGSVTAVPGQPGTFRATVTQNGVPMEITVGANGQILSRTPMTGTPAIAPNSGAVNAQTTTPLNGVAAGVNPNANTPFVATGA